MKYTKIKVDNKNGRRRNDSTHKQTHTMYNVLIAIVLISAKKTCCVI